MKIRGANENRYIPEVDSKHTPMSSHQSDMLLVQNTILGDKAHLRAIFNTGKLYGSMPKAAQIKAVEYAYGIKMFR